MTQAAGAGLLYFEDFAEGQVVELGEVRVTAEEIVSFAAQFDPQPFHLSEEGGRQSIYGGLIASGLHTIGMWMRLYVEQVLVRAHSMGSPGVSEVRWLKPVRPGDTLRCRWVVLGCRVSQSKPDRGLVESRAEVLNQGGELVLTLQAVNFFQRRPGAA